MVFYFSNYTRTADVLEGISRISYGGHSPNLSAAFAAVRSHIFVASNGARQDPSVLRLAVIFVTENPSIYRSSTLVEARQVADMNIGIVTVGVGTFVDRQLLSSITSYPTNRNMFVVPSVRNVTDVASDIKRIVCSGKICCDRCLF